MYLSIATRNNYNPFHYFNNRQVAITEASPIAPKKTKSTNSKSSKRPIPLHFGMAIALHDDKAVATNIGNLFLNIHRSTEPENIQNQTCRQIFGPGIFDKLEYFIKRREPIQLMIPAFPFKAPDPRKVLEPIR